VKSQDIIEVEGVIIEALPNAMFRVQLNDPALLNNGQQTILCTLSGKMRIYKIKVMPGDMVKCQVSTYDTSRGRIVFRSK
jgi:translation initiation factor IF-1